MTYVNVIPALDKAVDRNVAVGIEHFWYKLNQRTLFKMKVLPTYDCVGDEALSEDVEYFHYSICADDRMKYLGNNVVLEPSLSDRNKLCNAVIAHLYGGRNIHSLLTGITDFKRAHLDFERINTDPAYVGWMYANVEYAKLHGYKFYGTTELHTSLQTAARNFCREKYSEPERIASNTDIVEWVAGMITSGLVDDLLYRTKTLEEAYVRISSLYGIGAYYGYHLACDCSLLRVTPYNHDEKFCVPGSGARATMNMLFPTLVQRTKKVPYGELIVWTEEHQQQLYPKLEFHPALWNVTHALTGEKLFPFEQDKLMVYGSEVGHCQASIYFRLRDNLELVKNRLCGKDPDLTPIKLREEGKPIYVKNLKQSSRLLEF